MKILVITLHHVRNFGSMLQTYATQETLQGLGHEVEIIDFVPRGLTLKFGIQSIKKSNNILNNIIRKIAVLITFSDRQVTMLKFMKKNICLTKKSYSSFFELLHNPPEADAYISGSDQIWNTQNNNLPEDIKAYYLDFVPEGKKRIAYASSIGKQDFDEKEKEEVKGHLEKFDHVSVREIQAVKMLEDIGITNVHHVLDPTLLLTKQQWSQFLGNYTKKIDPYIFIYNLNRNQRIKEFARKLSKEEGLKIINFSDTFDFIKGAKNRIHNSAYDFIFYICNAEYVITDSFHGTAFSINLSKQFVTFAAPKYNSRIESILNLFNLKERMVENGRDPCDIIKKKIDYAKIQNILIEERVKSEEYLRQALSNNKSFGDQL